MMLPDGPVEHGQDLNEKVKWSQKCFPDGLSDLLISYDKTDCDKDADNDFEVNFDNDDNEFDITDDEKEFSDED